jgi:hypothetical protein
MSVVTSPRMRGLVLTDRDLTVLAELNRWRCMRSDQVAAYFPGLFRSLSAVKERLRKLEEQRFVVGIAYGGRGQPTVWYPKQRGVEACESPLPVTAVVGYMSVPHTLGLVDLYLSLRSHEPSGSWTTERELWRDRYDAGMRKGHVPDGRWSVGPSRIAVELELSRKAPSLYDPKMKWAANPYRGALSEGYTEVIYYADREQVRSRVRQAIRRNRAEEMVRVEPVPPTVRIRRWGIKGLDI